MKRALVVFAMLMVVLVVAEAGIAGWALFEGTRALDAERSRFAADQVRFRDQVMADQRRWAADPLFAPRDGGDASALLLQHVGWDQRPPPEQLPAEVSAALRDAGEAWLTRPIDVSAVDTRWMRELSAFAIWDLEAPGTPLHGTPFRSFEDDYPDFWHLTNLAKVRALQGLASGEPGPAIDDVTELARLSLTNERLISNMMGTALLGLARKTADEAATRGQDAGRARVFSEEEVRSLRATLWVSTSASSLLGSPAGIAPDFPLVGECAAQFELAGALTLRQYVKPVLPERYRELEEALQKSPCRVTRLRAAWATSGVGELPLGGAAFCESSIVSTETSCHVPDVVVHLPFVRQAVGARLLTIGGTDWFKFYRPEGEASTDPMR